MMLLFQCSSKYKEAPGVPGVCCLREGEVKIVCELARKIFERQCQPCWLCEREKPAKRVSHRLRKGKGKLGQNRRKEETK